MNKSPSFLFLPDISGFTDFVNHTEIDHSRHIIRELLELLLDEQELGLSLAEIEGDALFFYGYQNVPSPQALFDQVKKMFRSFHSHLLKYEYLRICQCGACSNAENLNLKFISHAGPLEFIQIKDQRKPFGKEVISAHRLMKNDVPSDQYLLLSDGLLSTWKDQWASPAELKQLTSSSSYDFGEVSYQYYILEKWRQNLPLPDTRVAGLKVKNPVEAKMQINASAPSIFEIVSNLEYRLLWNKGLTDLRFDRQKINQGGMEHLCLLNGQELTVETVSSDRSNGRWEYGERLKKSPIPFIRGVASYFTVEQQGETSLLHAEIHISILWPFSFVFQHFFKKSFEKALRKTLNNIRKIAEID